MPHCRSRSTYKGALQGDGAHTVWVGDVLIRAEAEGTDTYELNRNLVLTDGARADSVPNLEIETGEIVGAGHASATGRFDDEQLFYLQARGIPEDEARRLVVRGFFAELIRRIGVPTVEERLAAPRSRQSSTTMPSSEVTCDERPSASLSRRADLPDVGAVRVVVDGLPVAVVARRARGTCTPSATPARTPRSRSPRARSRAARSSAGCTARGSTCAPASRPALPAIRPVPVYPVTVDGDDVLVDVHLHRQTLDATEGDAACPPSRSATCTSRVETEQGAKEILRGVDLTVAVRRDARASWARTARASRRWRTPSPATRSTRVTRGTVTLDGEDVLAMTVDQRARAGLFLAMQYPVEVPGVTVSNFLRTAKTAIDGEAPKLRTWVKDVRTAMENLRIDPAFAERNVNEGFSGGEKKRHEILQLELLKPKIAILDETDSGLDVDALRVVSEGVNRVRVDGDIGILLITHYTRILRYIKPDFVHVFIDGRIVEEGGPELAERLEARGLRPLHGGPRACRDGHRRSLIPVTSAPAIEPESETAGRRPARRRSRPLHRPGARARPRRLPGAVPDACTATSR